MNLLMQLFDTSGFPPRWHCGEWSAPHGWSHIVADLAIFGAYVAIPCVLAYFAVRRRSIPFLPIFGLFAVFILSCGIGHLVEATIFWQPWYRFSALVKIVTALASWATVLALIPVVPKVLALRSPQELEREIAHRQQTEIDLAERNNQLIKSERLKSEFLANMSHELRTPLNSILILGQQLSDNPDGNLSSRQVEFAQTIHAAGCDLLTLINDILDLAKIESGTVTVGPEELAFAALGKTIERSFRHVAETKNLSFQMEFDSHLPCSLVTDPKRLLQVLKNLLSNAFKFTQQGSVKLHVGVAREGWNPDHKVLTNSPLVVAFAVSDTGIGIAPDKQRIVFEPFQQADASTSRKYGGTGLGLAISRELAHLLGGEIQLRSVPGAGSTFTLYLPQTHLGLAVAPIASETAADGSTRDCHTLQAVRMADRAEPIPGEYEDLVGKQVLVVDDDVRNIFALSSALERLGMMVLTASTGREAIATLESTPGLAIVLMDIMLPEMDGYQTMQKIRQNANCGRLPIIALTAKAMKGDREKCLDAGASDYLAKPVNTEQLVSALRLWLHRSLTRSVSEGERFTDLG